MSSNESRKAAPKATPVATPKGQTLVAVVGNPNAGKTTLFNALTGSHQKVGNYPGVTVEKVSGSIRLEGSVVECIDVPGLYSLNAVSEDERVAVDVIEGNTQGVRRPDLLVCVMDAGNLERNLFFYTQLAETGLPIVVALTMVDRVESKGSRVLLSKLSNVLGVEVIPVVGHKEKGLQELKAAIQRNLENPKKPQVDLGPPDAMESSVEYLRERLARIGIDYSPADVRHFLVETGTDFESYLNNTPEMKAAFTQAREELAKESTWVLTSGVSSRYEWAGMVERAVITLSEKPKRRSMTDKIDLILTHRVFGLLVFVGVMYAVFQSIYTFARPVMDGIQWVFDSFGAAVKPSLAFSPILQSLVVDGIIGGVGSMLVFLPQIMILFFFIAMLEGSGYLARAAFLMDRLLSWCGLNGRAFIPLLSSFACAIPGIMSARVMPDQKSRLATILVAPLMSCSARLPVYLLLIGAFIEPRYGPIWAGFALFAMHLLGLVVAIPIVWILNRKVLRGKRLPFLLELPPYQWPKWRDVWLAMYFRGKVFVTTAGTIIVGMSVLIWVLSYFPRSSEAENMYRATYAQETGRPVNDPKAQTYVDEKILEHSYLGSFGKAIEPAFRPAGFDWRITTSILSAFPARETVVPSLGIIFNLGEQRAEGSHTDLERALKEATWPDGRPLMTPWTCVGLMVFFALCCQCMSTLATIKKETNSVKWPIFVFTYMTVLAYFAAIAVNQLGLAFSK